MPLVPSQIPLVTFKRRKKKFFRILIKELKKQGGAETILMREVMMHLKRNLCVLILWVVIVLLPRNIFAESVRIARTVQPPRIDGRVDEPAWITASLFTDFKTIKPDFGLPPSEKTECYFLYDNENIYLAFRCFDREPDKIKAAVSHRDNPGNDDWIAFCLDTFNDEQSAFFFMINPRGIQTDGTLNSDASPDVTLDMIWSCASKITADGYSVEISIPFESLRYPSKDVVTMGFKVARNISRKSEEVDFPEYHPEKGAALAQFQKIKLHDIPSRQIFELLPAATLSQKHVHQSGEMVHNDMAKEISLTSKVGITSDLIIDATYNPDFSQVETDAGQIDVNLRYALYYPEKRPFFLEGQDKFNFAAVPEDAPLGAVVHTRTIVDPILGVKLNGKISKDDFLSAMYAQDEYSTSNSDVDNGGRSSKKNAHVSIIRYTHTFKNDNYLGGFYTGRYQDGAYNYLAGGDGRLRLNNSSYVEYHGFGSINKSTSQKGRDIGSALGAVYRYSTRSVRTEIGMLDISKNFTTDLGYLTRRGVTIIPMYAEYSFYTSSDWLQRITPYYYARHARDKYGNRYESFNVLSLRINMARQSFLNMQTWLANEIFSGTRFSRNAFRVEGETQLVNQLYLRMDIRNGDFIYYDSDSPFPGYGTRATVCVFYQPLSNLSFGLDVSYSDFFRAADEVKIYDYTIYRNRTVLQFNKYLFVRSVIEYNTYWKRINADFLASFTYIPGTVIYLGYGSVYQKLRWQENDYFPSDYYMTIEKNFFFKASYLWRW